LDKIKKRHNCPYTFSVLFFSFIRLLFALHCFAIQHWQTFCKYILIVNKEEEITDVVGRVRKTFYRKFVAYHWWDENN